MHSAIGDAIARWLHVLSGIMWIGLLYYFNFVNVDAIKAATADNAAAPITKYVVPRALFFFRWGAVATWVLGAGLLAMEQPTAAGLNPVIAAFGLQGSLAPIGIGAWLGTIMIFNVWVLIWPNQKKLLGLVPATDEQKAKARRIAFLASRTNTMLSIPMIWFMVTGPMQAAGLYH